MLKVENKDIKISYFIDENGVPTKTYVGKEKQQISPDGLIQLQCLPADNTTFDIVDKISGIEFNEVETIVGEYDFIVRDRKYGILEFHAAKNGTEVLVSYMGIGELVYSADRIFTNISSKGEVLETLGGILDDYQDIISGVNAVGDAATVVRQVSADVETLKNLNLNNILTIGNNVKEDLELIIPTANESKMDLALKINDSKKMLSNLNDWADTHGDIVNMDKRLDNISIDVRCMGFKEGMDADKAKNTELIQRLIDKYDDLVLYFPAGINRIGKLNLGTDKNITFRGKSSAFATSVNKSVSNPHIIDTYSRLVVDDDDEGYWLDHVNCTIIFDKISVINGVIDNTNTIRTLKKMTMVKTNANSTKGKVFATESSFIGWKNVSGDREVITKNDNLLHSCWLADRCRFNENEIGLAQLVDSRIIDCSFNKNDYAIIMKKNSGISTITNSRFEWNRRHGIFSDSAHDLIISENEFDRNSLAGLYIINLSTGNVTDNIFRRNGAANDLDRYDYEDNVHFVIKNSKNINISGNNTVAMSTLDTGAGNTRPTNCCQVSGNEYMNFKNNNLRGCTKSDKKDANKIENNLYSLINNMLDGYGTEAERNPEIHFMNGSEDEDATLIKTSNGMSILVDCGDETTGNWLCDRLIKLGVKKLDYLFITHSHSDHIGGAVAVLERMRPDVVYYKDITWDLPQQEVEWKTLEYHNKMVSKADELGIKKVKLTQKTTLNITESEKITFLNCGHSSDESDYNTDALMILHEYLGTKTLIQSDCYSSVAYGKYKGEIGHVDLLKMCHHGGYDHTSKGWLNELRPTYTFYTREQMDNLEYYKALVLTKLYTRDFRIHYSGCFIITDSGVIPTSTVLENRLEKRFINFEKKWCYVDETGQLVENGFITHEGKSYIVRDWYMVKVDRDYDWIYIEDNSYALMKDGSIVKNAWVQSNDTNKWYYCGDDGRCYKNTTKIIGMTSVTFDSEGNPNIQPT